MSNGKDVGKRNGNLI